MQSIQKMTFILSFGLVIASFCLQCNSKDAADDANTTHENLPDIQNEASVIAISNPEVTAEASGGIPALAELTTLQASSQDEAQTSAEALLLTTESMPLELEKQSPALVSAEENQGGNMFEFARVFGQLFDMVALAAQCNFNLLIHDRHGNKRTFRQLGDHPVYFLDGFGSIGLGDQGKAHCPDPKKVYRWAQHVGFIANKDDSTNTTDPIDKDEFHLPTRLVIYKKNDQKMRWKIVFFPKDFVAKIVKRIPQLKGLLDRKVDFVAYHGTYVEGTDRNHVELIADWNELGRMMRMLNSFDKNKSPSNDEAMPQGTITVNHRLRGSKHTYNVEFSDDMNFGDGNGDLPFETKFPITVKHDIDTKENYLYFVTNQLGDDPNDDGPLNDVGHCDQPGFGHPGFDGGPHAPITVKDVENYLEQPMQTHLELMWADFSEGKSAPDDYLIRLTGVGGPYIHGKVSVNAGKKSGVDGVGFQMQVPLCQRLTPQRIAAINATLTVAYNADTELWDPNTGMFNLLLNSFSADGGAKPATTAEITATFPTFTTFKFADVNDVPGITPVPDSGNDTSTTTQCQTAVGCLNYLNTYQVSLESLRSSCEAPEGQGWNGTFATEGCSETDLTAKCENAPTFGADVAMFYYGVNGGSLAEGCVSNFQGTWNQIVIPTATASCDYATSECVDYYRATTDLATQCTSSSGTWRPSTVCSQDGALGKCMTSLNNIYLKDASASIHFGETPCLKQHGGTWTTL